MYTASAKKKENIAEYLLYMWQIEDIIRAYKLDIDLICANIVADIIIRMTPDVGNYLADDGILLASGIIAERCDDVVAAFETAGFRVVEKLIDNDWCGLAVKRA